MVGSAVAIMVESRFCMNIAVATISAVRRVRLETRLGSMIGLGTIGAGLETSFMGPLWDGTAAEGSLAPVTAAISF